MKLGDSGDNVRLLQTALTRIGYPLTVDGEFGAVTEHAVKKLQEATGLGVDGVVGPKTQAKIDLMESALKPVPPASDLPAGSAVPTSSSSTVRGLDVSNWDKASDWDLIAGAGYKFGFIKTTEGMGFKNPYFATDFKNAKVAGLYRGGYHFFHPNMDARTQANFYLTALGGLFPTDLPCVLDLEQMNGTSAPMVIAGALTFLNQVRQVTKKQPILYTDLDILSQLGHPQAFREFPLWIAEPGRSKVSVPKPWDDFTFWQDDFHGKVPGVHGDADINLFNGTLTQLDAFARATR